MNAQNRAIIDDAMSRIRMQAERYSNALSDAPANIIKFTDALEKSNLRRALEIIADYAEGNVKSEINVQDVDKAIDLVIKLSFYNPLLDAIHIPMEFHKQPLGRLINSVRSKLIWLGEAWNLTRVSKELNVSRRTIYDWIEAGKLAPVWLNEQPLVPPVQLLILQGHINRNFNQIAEAMTMANDPQIQRAVDMLNDPVLKKSMEEALKMLNDPAVKETLAIVNDPAVKQSVELATKVLDDPTMKQATKMLNNQVLRRAIEAANSPLMKGAIKKAREILEKGELEMSDEKEQE